MIRTVRKNPIVPLETQKRGAGREVSELEGHKI